MTTGKPHCSVVVRAFNEARHIGKLMYGIAQQTLPNVEVILVDSGSTDNTVQIAHDAGARVVHICPAEFTFGRSLNLGIEAARADLIAIASAHVYPVYPDWLERLLAPFDDPQVGLTYGKQRGAPTSQFSEHQIFARWFPDVSQPRQPHPFCNNANAAIRRALWQQQPYDETLSGLEDLAWARWLMAQGYAISYVAEAEIIHVHNEKPQQVYNRYRREAMTFKRLFPDEHFGVRDLLGLTLSNIFSDLMQAARQGVLFQVWRSVFWFRWMQFYGTYQGYRQSGPLTWQLRQTFYYPSGFGSAMQNSSRQIQPIRYNL